jgi:hypothetical protein
MSETLTVRIDAELMRSLESEARRTRTSKGEVVRDALRHRLKRASRPSALDAMSALRGIMEGPPDLSTNKKYKSNFGKGLRRR